MEFGESKKLKENGGVSILEIGCRNEKVSYCVIGEGLTKHFDDYEDALDEFNLRWMRAKFG